jgi:phenylpropionate dioxygenase-like ring-hydroxylating dioxygenase large terminal subunit
MSFLQNIWYATAWSEEVAPSRMLGRTVADTPLVVVRSESGGIAVLEDRCPHRFAPLSMGQLTAHGIRCGYHGLEFDSSGSCIANPHGSAAKALRVRSFPAEERFGMIWTWFGPAGDADPAFIPDMSGIRRTPATAFSKGYLPTAANHLLLVDNILDLSHADYLHPHTLGGGAMSRTKAQVDEREHSIFVAWHALNEVPIPIFKPLLADAQAPCDSWTEVEWFANGVLLLRAGAVAVGEPWERGIDTHNAHIMTPESSGRTHYFYCNSRNYRVDDETYNQQMAAGLRAAFETEDKPMIEAQQRRIGARDLLEEGPALMQIDTASVRARRRFNRLLAQEASPIPRGT